MDCPEYRYIYSKVKCYKLLIYVNITTTYKYDPDKNMYQCIKRACDLHDGLTPHKKCNGFDCYHDPCHIINPLPFNLSPSSFESDPPRFLID